MAKISLEGMEFFAYHGCFSEEQIIGTKFIIDLWFEANTNKAEISDELADTIDYQEVYNAVKNEMRINSKLIEHVGRRILNIVCCRFDGVERATVKISKINPALGGKVHSVSITLSSDGQ